MRIRGRRWLGAAVLVAVCAGWALAGVQLTPQQKLLAMRAAQVDALRKLAEQVYGLRIDAQTLVRDFVAESDVIKTEVKAFLRGARQVGEPRWYADGACDVDYEMTLETIITNLKRIADGRVQRGRFEGRVFEQITQHTKQTTIRVTGSGAPRTEVDYGEDLGEGLATGVYRERMQVRQVPAGWENVTAQGRLMAMRAAQADAYRQIAERVLGLRIDSQTLVRDFVAESDEILTQVKGFIYGIEVTGQRFMSDQVAECDCQLTLETVITNLKRIADGRVRKGRFEGRVFEQITQHTEQKVIKATGRGVAPARFILGSTSAVGTTEPPPWSGEVVKATGSAAVDQAMLAQNAAQAWLNAERAAELDARRKIAEQVDGLKIDATTLVKDFVALHDEIRSDMSTFQQGARVVARRRLDDGTAEVDVELPLERLWLIVGRVKR